MSMESICQDFLDNSTEDTLVVQTEHGKVKRHALLDAFGIKVSNGMMIITRDAARKVVAYAADAPTKIDSATL